jgi:hypothetical protein
VAAQWLIRQGPLVTSIKAWMLRLCHHSSISSLQTARKQLSSQRQAVSMQTQHRQTAGSMAAMGLHDQQHLACQRQLAAAGMKTLLLHKQPSQLHRQHLALQRLMHDRPSSKRSAARTRSCSSRCGP